MRHKVGFNVRNPRAYTRAKNKTAEQPKPMLQCHQHDYQSRLRHFSAMGRGRQIRAAVRRGLTPHSFYFPKLRLCPQREPQLNRTVPEERNATKSHSTQRLRRNWEGDNSRLSDWSLKTSLPHICRQIIMMNAGISSLPIKMNHFLVLSVTSFFFLALKSERHNHLTVSLLFVNRIFTLWIFWLITVVLLSFDVHIYIYCFLSISLPFSFSSFLSLFIENFVNLVSWAFCRLQLTIAIYSKEELRS